MLLLGVFQSQAKTWTCYIQNFQVSSFPYYEHLLDIENPHEQGVVNVTVFTSDSLEIAQNQAMAWAHEQKKDEEEYLSSRDITELAISCTTHPENPYHDYFYSYDKWNKAYSTGTRSECYVDTMYAYSAETDRSFFFMNAEFETQIQNFEESHMETLRKVQEFTRKNADFSILTDVFVHTSCVNLSFVH